MKKIKSAILRLIATVALLAIYGSSWAIAKLLSGRGRYPMESSGRILVIGTFHNPNWFHAHIRPLTRSGVSEVILVCDEAVEALDNLRYECPPALLSKIFSRALAKFFWAIRCGWHYRPDLYMGYHIFPAAVSALVAARLFRRPACYQVTSGPLELEGGGWHAENRLLVALGRPSRLVERFVFAVVRAFDLVVVRGNRAADFVRHLGYRGRLCVITGSIEAPAQAVPLSLRADDLVFVGRLTEYKRPDRFVKVVSEVVKELPSLKAVLIGDGPDADDLKAQARALGVSQHLHFMGQRSDVPDLVARAKVFVLTSRWEGMSIAMLEAMAMGTVPVVAEVGDLGDIVRNDHNGYILPGDSIEQFREKIVRLLKDSDHWQACSAAASRDACEYSSTEAIAARWRNELSAVIEQHQRG
ncbi:MAG: glycosyltransferase [Pseudomonadota bacterium]